MQLLLENANVVNPFCDVQTHQNILIEDKLIREISSAEKSL